MADEIEFSAHVGSWVCIKKAKFEPGSKQIEVSRALASVHESMDRKIWENLKGELDLAAIDKVAYEITGAEYDEKKKDWFLKGHKTEPQIATALAKLNLPNTTAKLGTSLKHGKELAKTYLTRKVLDLLGFRLELEPKEIEDYMTEKTKVTNATFDLKSRD